MAPDQKGFTADDVPPIGTRVGGRYRLDHVLALGGMGVVFRAQDLDLDRPVAVKILPQSIDAGIARKRFLREARLMASVGDPHVVQVYDAGFVDGSQPYLVMQLLKGHTLARQLEKRGPLGFAHACTLGDQLCAALAAVHRAGIIHRDLKPSNVFLLRGKGVTLKLLDFGVSKPLDELTITQPGLAVGTPSYMAPEQAEGREVDDRTDVYGVGLVLWESLVGRALIPRDLPLADAFQRIMNGNHPPPSKLRKNVPDFIDALVMKAIAHDAQDRYPNALAMKAACLAALNRVVYGS